MTMVGVYDRCSYCSEGQLLLSASDDVGSNVKPVDSTGDEINQNETTMN